MHFATSAIYEIYIITNSYSFIHFHFCSFILIFFLFQYSYKEESEDETDSEDVIEASADWQDQEYVEDDREMIERILDSRMGRLDETGAKTTFYAYEKEELMQRGPPDPKTEETEHQYLIKWKGWSHLHNTWESERTLTEQKVKGMKKLENFVKREQDISDWYVYGIIITFIYIPHFQQCSFQVCLKIE